MADEGEQPPAAPAEEQAAPAEEQDPALTEDFDVVVLGTGARLCKRPANAPHDGAPR